MTESKNDPNCKGEQNRNRYQDISCIAPIRSRRLILSLVAESDAEDLQRTAQRAEIADTMISIPHPYPPGEASRYVQKHIDEAQKGVSIAFAIRQQDKDELQPNEATSSTSKGLASSFVGMIEVRAIDLEHSVAELSFWVVVEAWGKGFGREAVACVVEFVYCSPLSFPYCLNRLYAYHMVRNPACGALLKRNGFTTEGILRDRVWKHDRFEDVAICAILRKDWETSKGESNLSDDSQVVSS
mmetsp:Transcript_19466/g.36804  ORF Transcript_19466/g.36804 Transcript_19466/m.36804 type:complete len:242 (-) Transcript_19466:100-825(-)